MGKKKDTTDKINENGRIPAFDFDFDKEYDLLKQENNNHTRHKINVTVQSNDEYNGYNPIENPSRFFDFNILKNNFGFKFVMDNQDVFNDDCAYFTRNSDYLLFNEQNFFIWVPNDSNMHQSEILRVYLQRKTDKLMIPVLITKNTLFRNLTEYNISNATAIELSCFLSYHYQTIRDILNGRKIRLWKLNNLIPMNKLIEETGYPRCILVDEDRDTVHSSIIKVQNNLQITNSDFWATLTIDGTFKHDRNSDNKFNTTDRMLLIKFVENNYELINKLYKGIIKKDKFMLSYVKVDSHGNPVRKENSINYDDLYNIQYIIDDMIICSSKKTRLMNIIKDDKFIYDDWKDNIEYDNIHQTLTLYTDNWQTVETIKLKKK